MLQSSTLRLHTRLSRATFAACEMQSMHRLKSLGEPWGSKMLHIMVKRLFLVSALLTSSSGNRGPFSSSVSRHIVGGLNEGFPKAPCQFFVLGYSNTSSIRMPSKLLEHILNSLDLPCLPKPYCSICFGYCHRYPKDSEKLELARQTGLTRNQVMSLILNQKLDLQIRTIHVYIFLLASFHFV